MCGPVRSLAFDIAVEDHQAFGASFQDMRGVFSRLHFPWHSVRLAATIASDRHGDGVVFLSK